MANQELSNIKLSFEHDITDKSVDVIDKLAGSLKKLNDIKIDDNLAKTLTTLSKALSGFKGININANLGKGVEGLVDATNKISEVKDITSYSEKLNASFRAFSVATKSFKDGVTNISPNLGRGITGLVNATNEITQVKDITQHAQNIKRGFEILSEATKNFNSVSGTIPVNLGKGITGIVEAINGIDKVKDISLRADNLVTGFNILAYVSRNFNKFDGKIPVNLGRGITGIIEAINSIDEVKDLSHVEGRIHSNFATIAIAVNYFNNLNTADYSGIARLVTALTSIDNVKPIKNDVIDNAKKLAEAVNVLDKEVKADIPRLEAMANITRTLGVEFNNSSKGTDSFKNSLKNLNLAAKIRNLRTMSNVLKNLITNLYSTVDAFGQVENTMSFFSQSLGPESKGIANIVQQYTDLGAVDFTQFSNQVAKLNQIYKGYGIAASDAATMALNMTQLAYDASFALGENGKDIALWNQRATSVATGQTRAGYYFGVDTSVKALTESFDEMSSNSDKATRSVAAYNSMLENTKEIQGQMPREFQNTYVQMGVLRNRLKLLKQSIGQALIPMFQQLIFWAQVALKVVERVIDAIVRLFGGKGFQLINYADMIENISNSTGGLSDTTNDVADGIANANKQAKELKKTITGIDQVFTINDKKDTGGAGSANGVGGIGSLAPIEGYDWLEALASNENLARLEEIGARADDVVNSIKDGLPFVVAFGAGLAAWKISKGLLSGLKWISGLKGVFGGLGLDKLAGFTGFALLLGDLNKFRQYFEDFMENGGTFSNVSGMLSSFVGSIGDIMVMFGNISVGGAFKVVQGITDIVAGIKGIADEGVNWESVSRVLDGLSSFAIGIGLLKKDWATVGVGLIMQGGLAIINEVIENWEAIKQGDFSGIDKVTLFIGALQLLGGVAVAIGKFKKIAEPEIPAMKSAETITKTVSDTTGGVSTKLKDLAKNLGMGLLIMAEVAAAALIFVGAIWLVGEGLQKIGKAWEPVIADGANIAAGIALGTTLLVAVGVAAYALGTATVGSGGTIPLAIAAGTAMLVLLTAATVAFIQELKLVADQLANELSPAMANLNEVLPDLTDNTRDFTMFMIEFAGHLVAYTAASAVAGLAGTIDTIVSWFTKDPIKKMADDAKKNATQFTNLNNQLEITNPLVKKGNELMTTYGELLDQLKKGAEKAANIGSPKSIGIDFKDFSKSLKEGFKDLDDIKTRNISNIMSALNSLDLTKFRGIGRQIVEAMELGINNYNFNFTTATNKIKSGLTFSTTNLGTNIARDVGNGINNSSANLNTFVNKIKNSLTFSTNSYGRTMANDVISGINGVNVSIVTFTNRVKAALNFSSYYIGTNIAAGVVNGINAYYPNINTFINRLKNNMRVSFQIFSPSRWARDVIGENVALGVESGINDTKVKLNPFKDSISRAMYGIIDDIDIEPKFNMPTIDTKALYGDITSVSKDLTTKVQSQFEYTNDGTEKAVEKLTSTMNEKIDRLIAVTEDGKVIEVDGEVLGKTSEKYRRGNAVRLNTVFK